MDIGKIPMLSLKESIEELVSLLIKIHKGDWDLYERSWNFNRSPLLNHRRSYIADSYQYFVEKSGENTQKSKQLEQKLKSKRIL